MRFGWSSLNALEQGLAGAPGLGSTFKHDMCTLDVLKMIGKSWEKLRNFIIKEGL